MARGERTSWQALSTWCCSPATSSSFSNHERTGSPPPHSRTRRDCPSGECRLRGPRRGFKVHKGSALGNPCIQQRQARWRYHRMSWIPGRERPYWPRSHAICQCMLSEDNGFKRLKPEAETLLTGLVRPVKDYRHPRESEAPEHPQGPAAPGFPLFAGMTDETDYPLIWRGSYSRPALVCRAMAQLVPIVEPLPDLALKAAFAGPVENAPRDAVREIVLAGEPLLGGVVVDIAFAIAEVAHQPGRRVQDVHRRHQRAGLVRHPAGFAKGLISGVRL